MRLLGGLILDSVEFTCIARPIAAISLDSDLYRRRWGTVLLGVGSGDRPSAGARGSAPAGAGARGSARGIIARVERLHLLHTCCSRSVLLGVTMVFEVAPQLPLHGRSTHTSSVVPAAIGIGHELPFRR